MNVGLFGDSGAGAGVWNKSEGVPVPVPSSPGASFYWWLVTSGGGWWPLLVGGWWSLLVGGGLLSSNTLTLYGRVWWIVIGVNCSNWSSWTNKL